VEKYRQKILTNEFGELFITDDQGQIIIHRNEAFIGLFAVIILYATLHYLEKGDHLSLMLLTVATVLNFLAKETAYIYTAQLLLFVAIIFIDRILRKNWKSKVSQRTFILMAVGAIALLLLGLGFGAWDAN